MPDKAGNQMKMGEDFVPQRSIFEKVAQGTGAGNGTARDSGAAEIMLQATEALREAGDWRSLLTGFSRKIALHMRDVFAVFVVVSGELRFRWTTHMDRLGERQEVKYEELLPLNADFGESVKKVRGPSSGIELIDSISISTGCTEFILFRGTSRGNASVYLYTGGRRSLSQAEIDAFASVTVVLDSIIKREFAVGEQLAHSARLAAAIELGSQIGDSALASSFLNRAADTIQKKMGVDYVALIILDEGRGEVELAGISESLTPLYDTPQSMRLGKIIHTVTGQKEKLVIGDIETSGYRPLGTGVRWAALVPLETHSRHNALLILESRRSSPYSESELRDIELVSTMLSERLTSSIFISDRDRKVLLRNMLLEEMLLLHRESDPVKIADESLSFIESVVPSTISVFYVLNESRSTLIPVTSRGLFAEEMLSFSVAIGEGIVGKAISNDKPEIINDARADLRAVNMPGAPNEPESILVIPIKSIKEDIGVITLHRSGKRGYSPEDMDVISLVARQLSTVMERANAAVEMRKIVQEKETEAMLSSQLAEEFIEELREEGQETLAPRMLRRCSEFSGCDSGALYVRMAGSDIFRCVAFRPVMRPNAARELKGEEMEALKKQGVRLANNVCIIEDMYSVEDACDRLGFTLDTDAAGDGSGLGAPYMLAYSGGGSAGCESVFMGLGFQQAKSRQLFRGHLLQKLLSFFELRYSKINDRKIDSDELLRAKKGSYFKDLVYAETDMTRLFEKAVPAIADLAGCSLTAVYLVNYSNSSFDRMAATAFSGMPQPPERMAMEQAQVLVTAIQSRKKITSLRQEGEDLPFHSFFSNSLLVGKISSMDAMDYLVVAGYDRENDMSAGEAFFSELLKTLSAKVRQLTALSQERHRTGLLNLIDEMSRSIVRQGEFGRMLDAVSSAAGHLIGSEYALVGLLSSSNIEWNGYYDTRVPEFIEKLAIKSMEKGMESIVNDASDGLIAQDVSAGLIQNLMIYPVTARESGLPPLFILLINKLGGQGFNENDVWILERLSSNITASIKTIEALKQEKLMKRKAELKKAELTELLDGIEGGIIRIDNEGAISFANSIARKMLGLDGSDRAPKLVELLSDTDSLQVVDFMESIRKGERFEGEYTFHVGNTMRRIHVSGKQITDRGKKRGTVLYARDEGAVRQEKATPGGTGLVMERHAEIRGMRFELRRGFSYAVSEEKPAVAYATLLDLISAGFDALVISREHPSKLREKYDLGTADLRWLTQVVGNNNLDPSKLSVITSAIISFLERHDNAVVFLDGVEYLLANNNMIRVIAMMENVMQKVVDGGAVMLAAINRLTFDQKDLAMIGKMFEELDTVELKKRYMNRGIEEFVGVDGDSSNGDAND